MESDVCETFISVPTDHELPRSYCVRIFVTRLSNAEIWSMDSNLVTKSLCVCVCIYYIYVSYWSFLPCFFQRLVVPYQSTADNPKTL